MVLENKMMYSFPYVSTFTSIIVTERNYLVFIYESPETHMVKDKIVRMKRRKNSKLPMYTDADLFLYLLGQYYTKSQVFFFFFVQTYISVPERNEPCCNDRFTKFHLFDKLCLLVNMVGN